MYLVAKSALSSARDEVVLTRGTACNAYSWLIPPKFVVKVTHGEIRSGGKEGDGRRQAGKGVRDGGKDGGREGEREGMGWEER